MPLKTHVDEIPTLNLTPMIDVLFLLIIFFMLGTKFTELERNVPVQVPQVKQLGALSQTPARHTISVHRDGQVSLDRQYMSVEQLEQFLVQQREAGRAPSVVVRGDAESHFQTVAAVLSACRQAGVAELGISVRLAQQGAPQPRR